MRDSQTLKRQTREAAAPNDIRRNRQWQTYLEDVSNVYRLLYQYDVIAVQGLEYITPNDKGQRSVDTSLYVDFATREQAVHAQHV